jgi:hypothetical protein
MHHIIGDICYQNQNQNHNFKNFLKNINFYNTKFYN